MLFYWFMSFCKLLHTKISYSGDTNGIKIKEKMKNKYINKFCIIDNHSPFTINHLPFTIIPRGAMEIKGKGLMKTYFMENVWR